MSISVYSCHANNLESSIEYLELYAAHCAVIREMTSRDVLRSREAFIGLGPNVETK